MSCVRANILTVRPGDDGGSHEEMRESNAVGLDMCVHRGKPNSLIMTHRRSVTINM